MNYTISSEPFEKAGNRIKSQLTEKVIPLEGSEKVLARTKAFAQPKIDSKKN